MSPLRGFGICSTVCLVCLTLGCRTSQRARIIANEPGGAVTSLKSQIGNETAPGDETEVNQVSHQASGELLMAEMPGADDPFAGMTELPLDRLIAAVHDRNPSMQAAQAAWAIAAERYPQAISLEDPMLQTMFAPASFASNMSQSSYYLGAAQKIPWHGKRALRGETAKWESVAASWDAEEVKLRLAAAARMAFFDYYLVRRELELNNKNVDVMQDFRGTARTKYEANQVSQQDLSAADLELAKLKQQRLELKQAEWMAVARINTLLHRRPDHSLPAPPQQLTIESSIPDSAALRDIAGRNRPELAAINARIQSEQNAVALACKQYYPDFEFMGRYDAFWTDAQQRPQVGMNMNVPIQKNRLAAAVREAQFRVTKLVADYALQADLVNEEVEIACARASTNHETAVLFETTILPSAQTNLDTARNAYIAGSIDFLRLMEARRQFIDQQIGYQKTLTEYHRSRSDLERAVGTNIGSSESSNRLDSTTIDPLPQPGSE
jgi:cobalt-zinc-cadmium efflux system outer membrane protein